MKNVFIGIDFSKKDFDVTLIDRSQKEKRLEQGKFGNNPKGFKGLLRWVSGKTACPDKSRWLFCGETTGLYSQRLPRWLYENGIDMWIESAYSIKRSLGLVRGKNDLIDSARIAEYAMEKWEKAVPYTPLSESVERLKTMLMRRKALVNCRCKLQNVVKESVAVLDEKDPLIVDINNKILGIVKEIKGVEEEMRRLMDECARKDAELCGNYAILCSICGVSVINAVAMLVYTRNFTAFKTARRMMCYWGLAPFGIQSGTSVHTGQHVSVFCNHWIKGLLSEAAKTAVSMDSVFRDYYLRLVGRGKKPGVAMNNVKAKIINVAFTLVKNNTTFDKKYNAKNNVKKTDNNVEATA